MDKSDRELLELAAKAAGYASIDFLSQDHWANVYEPNGRHAAWNPLTDDGDALRLAVQLKFGVDPWGAGACVIIFPCSDSMAQVREPHYGDDPARATRRAIVRAAAEIGKAMP